jgi:hypothetical protein
VDSRLVGQNIGMPTLFACNAEMIARHTIAGAGNASELT